MSEKEVEAYVLIILQARIAINKKGGRKHIPLPKNAKDAVLKKKYVAWFLYSTWLYPFCIWLWAKAERSIQWNVIITDRKSYYLA